jgi:hypothetical protein
MTFGGGVIDMTKADVKGGKGVQDDEWSCGDACMARGCVALDIDNIDHF